MRKSAFCICVNKGTDVLWGNRVADQRLVLATKIVQSLYFLLNSKSEISSPQPSSVMVQPGL